MTLPKQAQRQIDEARRIQEEMAQQRTVEDQNPEVVVVDPPADDPPAPVDPQPSPAHEEAPWEERYHHLEGKYNAEVPRLAAQNRGLTEQIADLQEVVSSLKQQSTASPPESGDSYTAEEVDRYGADLIDLIKRVARAEVLTAKTEMVQLVDGVRGEVGDVVKTQTLSREQEFIQHLDTHVSTWRELNRDVRFLQWLEGLAPFSRKPKQAFLDEAVANFDGPGAAAFFTAYIEETSPPPAAPPAQPPKNELESQMQPRRHAGSGQPPSAQQARSMTRSEIARFYNECARGMWNNRPVEKAQREAEIFSAQREGRIVEG